MGVLPTLLELAGSTPPEGIDGLSLVPLLHRGRPGEEPARGVLERRLDERALVVHRVAQNPDEPVAWAVMKGSWKLIEDGERVELYDMANDIREVYDRMRHEPVVSAALTRSLSTFREETRPIDPQKVDVLLDPQTVEALRTLGYGD